MSNLTKEQLLQKLSIIVNSEPWENLMKPFLEMAIEDERDNLERAVEDKRIAKIQGIISAYRRLLTIENEILRLTSSEEA